MHLNCSTFLTVVILALAWAPHPVWADDSNTVQEVQDLFDQRSFYGVIRRVTEIPDSAVSDQQKAALLHLRGLAHAERCEFSPAFEDLKAAYALSPEDLAIATAFGKANRLGYSKASDSNLAFEILSRASRAGSADASYQLAIIHLSGDQTNPDARRYLDASLAGGDSRAMLTLARMHQHGVGVEKDLAAAYYYYRRAADHGEAEGAYEAFAALTFGNDVDKDPARAVAYFQQALEAQYPAALFIEGLAAHKRGEARLANHFYWRAAELGHKPSQINLGINLMTANGVRGDYDRAWYWLSRAGDPYLARYYRGMMLHAGLGREANVAAALAEYEAASAMPRARALVAVMYEKGIGTEVNLGKANELRASLIALDAGAVNGAAWSIVTHPDEAVRSSQLGLELAKLAVKTDPSVANEDTLAAAYAATGDFRRAVRTQKRVIKAADKDTDPQISDRLDAYQKKRPWIDIAMWGFQGQHTDQDTDQDTDHNHADGHDHDHPDSSEGTIVAVFRAEMISTQGNRIGLNRGPNNYFGITLLVEQVESGALPDAMSESFTYYVHSPAIFFSKLSKRPGPLQAPADPHRFTLKEVEGGPWRYVLEIEELASETELHGV